MPIWPRLTNTLRTFAGRGPIHEDLDREVQSYRDMLVDEKVAQGVEPAEARRQATLEIGGVEQVKESVRASRPAAWLDNVVRDLRFALRLLLKTPGFTLTAIVNLAIGIGACVAVFSLVNMIFFQSLGWTEASRVVGVYCRETRTTDSYRAFSYAELTDIRQHRGALAQVAAYRTVRVGLSGADAVRRVRGVEVSSNFFATLGVTMYAGRGFSREEERPGSLAPVAIVSYDTWVGLGGGHDLAGRTLLVNGQRFSIVGVTPPSFTGLMPLVPPEVWLPLGAHNLLIRTETTLPAEEAQAARTLTVLARLQPGVSLTAADADLATLAPRFAESDPNRTPVTLTLQPLARTQGGSQPASDQGVVLPLATLMLLALVLLLIASLNVANMQLARGRTRAKEIAMRLSLGASRARVLGQLLLEGVLLSVSASALGLLAGMWVLQALASAFAPVVGQSTMGTVPMDLPLGLATVTFTVLCALVFALVPAWRLSRADLVTELKTQAGAAPARRGRGLTSVQNLLVAGQTALSLALLAATGLFVRAGVAAGQAEPGYRLEGQLIVRMDAALAGYVEAEGRRGFGAVAERLRATPGVESVALASSVAFGNEWDGTRVKAEGQDGDGVVVTRVTVSSSYFSTLGLSVRAGRDFTRAEELPPAGGRVAIIDEPLAALLFRGRDPIGRRVFLAGKQQAEPVTIVGIAPGQRQRLTDREPVPHLYVPLGAAYRSQFNAHVRTRPGAEGTATLLGAVRAAVREADPHMTVVGIQTLEDARDSSPATWMVRIAGRVLGAFGLVALLMAGTGLYGVKAYLVAQRRREIGIRMAIGASPSDVVRMVMREGLWLLGGALVGGAILALVLGQVVRQMLVGVSPLDPIVLGGSALALTAAVLAACYGPARRATRIQPTDALRLE